MLRGRHRTVSRQQMQDEYPWTPAESVLIRLTFKLGSALFPRFKASIVALVCSKIDPLGCGCSCVYIWLTGYQFKRLTLFAVSASGFLRNQDFNKAHMHLTRLSNHSD